jgi:hypothetical protein
MDASAAFAGFLWKASRFCDGNGEHASGGPSPAVTSVIAVWLMAPLTGVWSAIEKLSSLGSYIPITLTCTDTENWCPDKRNLTCTLHFTVLFCMQMPSFSLAL